MKLIGLTGGIATGKSLVARTLEEMGAVVIDADLLAREVVQPGTGPYHAIVETFGEGILHADGTLDRKALGRIVFSDANARVKLEQITHPAILRLGKKRIEEERAKGTEIVFYIVPLLFEAGLSSSVDEVWVVYADKETQVERLMQRDGIDQDEALRKMAAQMPLNEKVKLADEIIDNSGSRENTQRRVKELWLDLQRR